MKRNQAGVGLIEVLVALVILSIAILGFVALQVRALAASQEASLNVQAMTLARDLSERIRMNRDGLKEYKKDNQSQDCAKKECTPNQMAGYDFNQVKLKADKVAMSIDVLDCQMGHSTAAKRKCIYVAWGNTTATNGTGNNDCTKGTAYQPGAQCVIMETYNYE